MREQAERREHGPGSDILAGGTQGPPAAGLSGSVGKLHTAAHSRVGTGGLSSHPGLSPSHLAHSMSQPGRTESSERGAPVRMYTGSSTGSNMLPWNYDAHSASAPMGHQPSAPGRIESQDSFAASFPRGARGLPGNLLPYAQHDANNGLSPSGTPGMVHRHSIDDSAFLAAVERQQGGARGGHFSVSPHGMVPAHSPAAQQARQQVFEQQSFHQQMQQHLYQQQVQRLLQSQQAQRAQAGGRAPPHSQSHKAAHTAHANAGQSPSAAWGVAPHSAVAAAVSAAAARGIGIGGGGGATSSLGSKNSGGTKRLREGSSDTEVHPPHPQVAAKYHPTPTSNPWKSGRGGMHGSPASGNGGSSGRLSDRGQEVRAAPSLTLSSAHPPTARREDMRDMGDTPLPSRPIDTERMQAGGGAGEKARGSFPGDRLAVSSLPLPPRHGNGSSRGMRGADARQGEGLHGGYTPGQPGGIFSRGMPPGFSPANGMQQASAAYYGGGDPEWDSKGHAAGFSPTSFGASGWTPRGVHGGSNLTPSQSLGSTNWMQSQGQAYWGPSFQQMGAGGGSSWPTQRDGGVGTPHSSAGQGGGGSAGQPAGWRPPPPSWSGNPWASTPPSSQGGPAAYYQQGQPQQHGMYPHNMPPSGHGQQHAGQ